MLAEITNADLITVVDEIFASMAGMHLVPVVHPSAFGKHNPYIVAAVQIVGDWQGAVRLDIHMELAREACANLVGVEAAAVTLQDIRDAAGELANMTGGSVKALCSPSARLSLPSVAMGHDFEFSVLQGEAIQEASFRHAAGELRVSVIERQVG